LLDLKTKVRDQIIFGIVNVPVFRIAKRISSAHMVVGQAP